MWAVGRCTISKRIRIGGSTEYREYGEYGSIKCYSAIGKNGLDKKGPTERR